MLRATLATRLTLIAMVALTTVMVGAIALFYLSRHLDRTDGRPDPAQVAAVVALVERTPAAERPAIADALHSRILAVRVEPGGTLADAPARALPLAPPERQPYAAALGARAFTLWAPPVTGLGARFPRLFASAANALEFRIALDSGDTLVIDSSSPVVLSRIGLPVGFGAGLFGTVVALLALLVMQRETRQLARLAAAAERIDPSGEPVQLPRARTSAPEIRALIAAFERMQTRLAQLQRARMAMLGGISHDVRSFATRLRLRVEQIPDPDERARAITDIADMIRLLDDALLASRAGAGELTEELFDLDEIVASEVRDRRAAGAPVDLHLAPAAIGATILGDRLALRRVVANLIGNALSYGHVAHVGLGAEAGVLVLTVDDEGPGIPPEQREILLEPFVRAETSRNRRTGGGGLGLAIARGLVEAHGGSIAIDDAPTGGARLTVRLARFRPS
ncbi:MAG: HAMP domain-containing protein [Rhodobacteraceae bacterium]|nr:HAMP domain-containing protein [Paracoccaceae bacterium]